MISFDLLQTLTLVFIDTVSLFLLIVVSSNSLKISLNRWFVIMTLCLLGWVNFSYFGFTDEVYSRAVLYYRLNWAFVSLFFYSAYVFYIEHFLKIKKMLLHYFLLAICSGFFLLSIFSDLLIKGVTKQEWGNEIEFGDLNTYFSIFSVAITCMFIYYFIIKYKGLSRKGKNEVIYFLLGTFALIGFNLIFNVFAPLYLKTARFQIFGDFSSIIFLSLTAFAILRYRFLGVKIALTALFISIIGMFLVLDIFLFSRTNFESGVKVIALIIFVYISVLLVQSVLTEINQKEKLAQANKALDKSRNQYIDLASQQKDIIDVMGHEIRTPLTSIIQELNLQKVLLLPKRQDWLDNKIDEADRIKGLNLIFDSLNSIDTSTIHAVQLVNDMLETARLDKKHFELDYSEFDIVALVKESTEMMRKTIEDGACELIFSSELQNSFKVEADKTRIKEAVDALISNAIKYRDQTKTKCSIKVILSNFNHTLKIDITDNGIGIAPEDIEKLGKKFARLNPKLNGTLKRPGGTGLGLFVVKGIMDYHKGKLKITSDGIGKGSTFTLEFPIKKASA